MISRTTPKQNRRDMSCRSLAVRDDEAGLLAAPMIAEWKRQRDMLRARVVSCFEILLIAIASWAESAGGIGRRASPAMGSG